VQEEQEAVGLLWVEGDKTRPIKKVFLWIREPAVVQNQSLQALVAFQGHQNLELGVDPNNTHARAARVWKHRVFRRVCG